MKHMASLSNTLKILSWLSGKHQKASLLLLLFSSIYISFSSPTKYFQQIF